MKGYEIALKAVDEIVSAISEIQGCDSNGDEWIVSSSDEIVSFEHGKITVQQNIKTEKLKKECTLH